MRQETTFPDEERSSLLVTEGSAEFTLMIRYPFWVADGALKVRVNGKPLSISARPSSYIAVQRIWSKGDVVEIVLPMHTRLEHLPNVPEYIAFMHGPILLAAKTGTEDLAGLLADDGRWGQTASGRLLPVDKAPMFVENDLAGMSQKLVPVKDRPLTFTVPDLKMINPMNVVLEPFFRIHDARYMMYWMALTNTQYQSHLDSLAVVEKAKLALQQRTVDSVAAGEQQPEADHALQCSHSNSGTNEDKFYRDAGNGGFFSYVLATKGETGLSLMVRYWGFEWGGRKFDISIDDEKLVTVDNTDKRFHAKFQDVEYAIPSSMLKGKDHIRVKFQAMPGNTAGGVYYLRLTKSKDVKEG